MLLLSLCVGFIGRCMKYACAWSYANWIVFNFPFYFLVIPVPILLGRLLMRSILKDSWKRTRHLLCKYTSVVGRSLVSHVECTGCMFNIYARCWLFGVFPRSLASSALGRFDVLWLTYPSVWHIRITRCPVLRACPTSNWSVVGSGVGFHFRAFLLMPHYTHTYFSFIALGCWAANLHSTFKFQ